MKQMILTTILEEINTLKNKIGADGVEIVTKENMNDTLSKE
jgi:hypothetical protein